MSDYEDFITAVDFLKDKYGIVKQTIADEIGINRNTFNKALSGERVSKCGEYAILIKSQYKDLFKHPDKEAPVKKLSNFEAWDMGLIKMDEILKEIKELKKMIEEK